MTNDEKELMQDLINQASGKVELLQNTLIEKDAEIDKLKEKIKQAQIDILNELKSRHDYAVKNMGYPWDISQQIEELIKEVNENDADKKTH